MIRRVPGCFRGLHLSNTVCQLRAAEPVAQQRVPVSQYLDDAKNGTLPSVAFIETGYLSQRMSIRVPARMYRWAPLTLRA